MQKKQGQSSERVNIYQMTNMENEKDVGKQRDQVVQCKHCDFWETLVHFKALSQWYAARICECFIYLRYQTLSRAHWPQHVEFLHLRPFSFPCVLISSHLRFDPVRQESLVTRSIHQRPRQRPSRALSKLIILRKLSKRKLCKADTAFKQISSIHAARIQIKVIRVITRFCWRTPLSEGNSEAREMWNGFLYLCRE